VLENNAQQQAALFANICKVSNQYQAIGDKYYNSISLKQEHLLWVMDYYFKDVPPTLNNLAGKIGSSHQNIKQMVVKLIEKGYLTLEQDADDRRKRRVCFTEKYMMDKEEFDKRRKAFVEMVFNDVSEKEIEDSVAVINKMMANLSKMLNNATYMLSAFTESYDTLDLDKNNR